MSSALPSGKEWGCPGWATPADIAVTARAGARTCATEALFTGYTLNGGYAEYTVADQRYCFPIPEGYGDAEAAPLLCAGLIGYRALVAAGDAEHIGIYGFGAAAHIIAQVAHWQGRKVFAFTRPGDVEGQRFARELGADWAGDSDAAPPQEMDAAILFAPVGALIPQALRHTAKGGTVVCGGIHMSDVPAFPYSILWGERSIRSIANLTRRDGEEFLALAPKAGVQYRGGDVQAGTGERGTGTTAQRQGARRSGAGDVLNCIKRLTIPRERHKPHRLDVLALEYSLALLGDQNQLLDIQPAAHRDHHAPTDLELIEQRLWHMGCRCSDDDAVIRRMFRPPCGTVIRLHFDIAITQFAQHLGSGGGKRLDDLHAVDPARHF